jgi:hypothetical protein
MYFIFVSPRQVFVLSLDSRTRPAVLDTTTKEFFSRVFCIMLPLAVDVLPQHLYREKSSQVPLTRMETSEIFVRRMHLFVYRISVGSNEGALQGIFVAYVFPVVPLRSPIWNRRLSTTAITTPSLGQGEIACREGGCFAKRSNYRSRAK